MADFKSYKYLFLCVLCLFPAWAAPAAAQQILVPKGFKCKAAAPQFTIDVTTERTEYVRNKSSADLTAMKGVTDKNSVIGGLGGGEVGFKTASLYETQQYQYNDQSFYCLRLSKLDLVFYAIPQIHIANNFPPGTCEYRAVKEHEKGHIRIMLRFISQYAPNIKRELRRITQEKQVAFGPIAERDLEKAQQYIEKQIFNELMAYYNKITPILDKRQAAFDSPEEYARVEAQCKNWNKQLKLN